MSQRLAGGLQMKTLVEVQKLHHYQNLVALGKQARRVYNLVPFDVKEEIPVKSFRSEI